MTRKRRSSGARGGGQKLATGRGLLPACPPSAEFFFTGGSSEGGSDGVLARPNRGGIPRHSKTDENTLLVSDLVKAGQTRAAIALAIGIAESTLYAIYFSELRVGSVQRGRPRHVPTDANRALVARMRRAGASKMTIAKALGVSEPTLRRAYPDQLQFQPKENGHDD